MAATATPTKTRRRPRPIVLILSVAIIVAAIVAATSSSSPVTRADAIQNVVNKIDSGPSWETAQDSAAVSGYLKWQETNNGSDGGGDCATIPSGFACYLTASQANGGESVYFSENKTGGAIHPISGRRYNQLVGG